MAEIYPSFSSKVKVTYLLADFVTDTVKELRSNNLDPEMDYSLMSYANKVYKDSLLVTFVEGFTALLGGTQIMYAEKFNFRRNELDTFFFSTDDIVDKFENQYLPYYGGEATIINDEVLCPIVLNPLTNEYRSSLVAFNEGGQIDNKIFFDQKKIGYTKFFKPHFVNVGDSTLFIIHDLYENLFECFNLYDPACLEGILVNIVDASTMSSKDKKLIKTGEQVKIHAAHPTPSGGVILSGQTVLEDGSYSGWIMTMDKNGSTTFIKEPKGFYTNTIVYPNPTTESVRIQAAPFGSAYTIYNSQGHVVLTGRIEQETIDVSKLAPGNYQIQVNSKEQILLSGFIKQ